MRIKWPNDVYAGGLKLGGVLCHSAYRARRFATVTGVGLNLANREPTTCVDALIAARHAELALPGAPAAVPREARSVAISWGPLLSARSFFVCFYFAALYSVSTGLCLCQIMLGWRCMAAARLCHARHAPDPIRASSSALTSTDHCFVSLKSKLKRHVIRTWRSVAPLRPCCARRALHRDGPFTSSKRFRVRLVTPSRRPACTDDQASASCATS